MTFSLSLKGWSSFTTGASKIASAAKEGVSNQNVFQCNSCKLRESVSVLIVMYL